MAIALYFDVHVDYAIVGQLRARQVDVLTSQEDQSATYPDDRLLMRASELRRVLFTHDIRLQAMAEQWARTGRQFRGVIFAHLPVVTIGQCVKDLELIAKATDASDWASTVIRLPL
jgi:hypothetical protein